MVAADFSPPSSGSEGRVRMSKGPLHLVVGCCLADLYSPSQFVAMLLATTMTYNTHPNTGMHTGLATTRKGLSSEQWRWVWLCRWAVGVPTHHVCR
jgi:hypothetical protein